MIAEKARAEAIKKAQSVIAQLQEDKDFDSIKGDKNPVLKPLQEIIKTIENSKDIDFINQRVSDTNISTLYTQGLEKIEELMPQPVGTPVEVVTRVNFNSVKPRNISKLESNDDVTAYIKILEENLRKQIEDGKQIIL